MSTDMVRTASAMAEAVKILAQDGNWRRALAVHHPGNGGRCASCGQRIPCTIASLATAAKGQATTRAAAEARAVERAMKTLAAAPESTPTTPRTRRKPMREAS